MDLTHLVRVDDVHGLPQLVSIAYALAYLHMFLVACVSLVLPPVLRRLGGDRLAVPAIRPARTIAVSVAVGLPLAIAFALDLGAYVDLLRGTSFGWAMLITAPVFGVAMARIVLALRPTLRAIQLSLVLWALTMGAAVLAWNASGAPLAGLR